MDNEQRHHPRSTAYIIAKYTVIEGTFRDVVNNISAGGFSFRTQRKVAVGQPIAIELPLFEIDKIIKVKGRIVRKDPIGFAVTLNEPIHGLVCKDGQLPEIVHMGEK